MAFQVKARISSVRGGFSYERDQVTASSWDDLMAKLKPIVASLSEEAQGPDSVLISLERPTWVP